MSVSVGQARLKDAHKQMVLKWERTRQTWDDSARQAFERDVMVPMPTKVAAAMGAMSRLAELINTTSRECR